MRDVFKIDEDVINDSVAIQFNDLSVVVYEYGFFARRQIAINGKAAITYSIKSSRALVIPFC